MRVKLLLSCYTTAVSTSRLRRHLHGSSFWCIKGGIRNASSPQLGDGPCRDTTNAVNSLSLDFFLRRTPISSDVSALEFQFGYDVGKIITEYRDISTKRCFRKAASASKQCRLDQHIQTMSCFPTACRVPAESGLWPQDLQFVT